MTVPPGDDVTTQAAALAALTVAAARASLPALDGAEVAAALGEVVGDAVSIEARPPYALSPGEAATQLLGDVQVAVLALRSGDDVSLALAEFERPLAMAILRALGVESVGPAGSPLTDGERGVLLYAASEVTHRALGDGGAVRAVLGTGAAAASTLGAGGAVCFPFTIRWGERSCLTRLWTPSARTVPVGSTPATLAVIVGHGAVPAAELADAAPGDVVLLDTWPSESEDAAAHLWLGAAVVGTATVTQGAATIVRLERGPVPSPAPGRRSVAAALGLFTRTLAELAALAPGDRLVLGDDPSVTLLVDGRPWGLGTLATIGGERGVRIAELL